MNYKETLNFLYSSLPMYQRQGQSAYKASLDNTIVLDNHLGNPHKNYKSIHIAGTNGKGSVSHMLAAILQKAGYKTGLYTSPHLKDFRERIKVNGKMIPEDYVAEFISKNFGIIKKIEPSFFEMSVAMAFKYFADENIDIAVVETGMGGRLDSTNIITPILSVITNISFDHTQFLGTTLEAIAAEKAGIIKDGIPLVIGEWQEEIAKLFSEIAHNRNTPVFFASKMYRVKQSMLNRNRMQVMNVYSRNELVYKEIILDLLGHYQKKNIPTLLQILDIINKLGFPVPRLTIYNALKKVKTLTGLRGRWDEIGLNPLIICDTGHNESGLKEVMEQIKLTRYKKLHIVFGMVSDKDPCKILPLLPDEAIYYFTNANIPRALSANKLKEYAQKYSLKGDAYGTVSEALTAAKDSAEKEDLIFIGGSTFVVAEALP
jgi:dihydrofolate synthase / folylpolyglutamate synthase